MDFYTIPPRGNLDLMNLGDRYFCLSQQYLKDEAYRNFFKKKVSEGAWVTLDNGAGDHETVTKEQLLDIARDLRPSELIPLDELFNAEATLTNLDWTISQMSNDPQLKHIEVFACPQGETFSEWMDCYHAMIINPNVHTIGMSKLAIPYVISKSTGDKNIARDRNLMYNILKSCGWIVKPLHFLGAGEPWEFESYKNDPLCRSTDSCFAIWMGMNGLRFDDPNYKRIPTPRDYFDRIALAEDLPDIIANAQHLKEILS